MKCGRQTRGFTIVETMIFLAVSGALLLVAMGFITSTQSTTQFNQGANDALQQINKVVNNVSNGYYAGNSDVVCTKSAGGLTASSTGGGDSRGTNADCVFLGRVISFGTRGSDTYTAYDVAGLRVTNTGGEVDSMLKASPTRITGTEEQVTYRNGLQFGGLKRGSASGFDAAGFFGSLGKIASSGSGTDLESTAQQFDFVAFNQADFPGAVTASYESNKTASMSDGIKICLYEGNRQAVIAVGGAGQSANAIMTISSGDCSSW